MVCGRLDTHVLFKEPPSNPPGGLQKRSDTEIDTVAGNEKISIFNFEPGRKRPNEMTSRNGTR